MGPYKPLRTWVDEFIPYYMEISWELIDPIAHLDLLCFFDACTKMKKHEKPSTPNGGDLMKFEAGDFHPMGISIRKKSPSTTKYMAQVPCIGLGLCHVFLPSGNQTQENLLRGSGYGR